MRRGELVLGLVAAPEGRADPLTGKLRDLSIAWSRYGYRDAILEGAGIDAVLSAAAERGHRYCLVLAPGVLIRECWRGEAEEDEEFHSALARWIDENEFAVVGRDGPAGTVGRDLDDRCLLVDLERHRALGSPAVVEAARRGDLPVTAFDRPLREQFLDLAPAFARCAAERDIAWDSLHPNAEGHRCAGEAIADFVGRRFPRERDWPPIVPTEAP